MHVEPLKTIRERLDQFSGREWLLPILRDWLEKGDERIFLLKGDPGTGKSMIVAWLAERVRLVDMPELVIADHFLQVNSRNVTPLVFAEGIANQLSNSLDGFDEALTDSLKLKGLNINVFQNIENADESATIIGVQIGRISLAELANEDSFDLGFVQPLKHLYRNGYDKPILVLVDALDEAYSDVNEGRRLVRLLSSLADLPEQVRILATSRPDPRVIKHFRQERLFDLVVDARQDSADIYEFAQSWLLHRSKLELDEPSANQLARYIDNAASGIFLYAYLVLRDVVPALQLPITEEEFQLPNDLSDLYQNFLTRELGQDEDRWFDELKPLLGLIAVAQGDGLTRSQLKKLLGHDPTKNLRICHQYLSGELNDGPFRLFHKSLADYLLDDEDNTDYEIDAVEMHGCLADQIDLKMVDWYGPEIDPYYLRSLPAHMNGAGRQAELRQLLLDFGYLRAKLAISTISVLISDFDNLATQDRQDAGRLIQDALRLSANVLAKDKKQLSSQLYGRLLPISQPELIRLRSQIADQTRHPWLQLMSHTMGSPGGAKRREFVGHKDEVTSVALSADGRTLISGSVDGTVRLWDMETALEQQRFEDNTGSVYSVALSADGRTLVSGSEDSIVRLWDMETGQVLRRFEGHTKPVTSVALSADGRTLVSGSGDGTIRLWDVDTGRQRQRFEDDTGWVFSVALSADGRTLVSGSIDSIVRLWDIEMGQVRRRFVGHVRRVYSVALSADGRILVSGSDDHTVRLWDMETGQMQQPFEEHPEWVASVALSADGRTLATGCNDKRARLWDIDTAHKLRRNAGYAGWVNSVALSKDDRNLVSGSGDNTIRLWDVETGRELRRFEGLPGRVHSVVLHADSRTLLFGSSGTSVIHQRSIDADYEPQEFKGHAGEVISIALSEDGYTLASGSSDTTLRLWDVKTRQVRQRFEEHTASVNSVALSADGNTLVSGSGDKSVRLWDVETGRELRRFEGHADSVTSVALNADARTLVSGSWDHTVRLWDIETGQELCRFEGHTDKVESVSLSADGRTLVSGSRDYTVRVWNLASGKQIAVWTGNSYANSCDISSDGRVIVAGVAGGRVHIFNLANYE